MKEHREQIRYLIEEARDIGMSIYDLRGYFPGVSDGDVSASVSQVYAGGDIRRDVVPKAKRDSHSPYRYFYEVGARPVRNWKPRKSKKSNAAPTSIRQHISTVQIALDKALAWIKEATERYPDLGVKPVVLEARKFAAGEFHDDPSMREDILKGHRDQSAMIRAIVKALEMNK